jgi:putative ABC transport system ATP-binding protein
MILGTDAKETLVQTADNETKTPDGAAPVSAVVTARDLTRCYGEGETAVHALRGVSREIERARLTAVMGRT